MENSLPTSISGMVTCTCYHAILKIHTNAPIKWIRKKAMNRNSKSLEVVGAFAIAYEWRSSHQRCQRSYISLSSKWQSRWEQQEGATAGAGSNPSAITKLLEHQRMDQKGSVSIRHQNLSEARTGPHNNGNDGTLVDVRFRTVPFFELDSRIMCLFWVG